MNAEKWFLIVNPIAGSGQGRKQWTNIEELLRKMGIEYDYAVTDFAGHGIALVNEAASQGYRKFIAVGGDGTANEVVNGICMQQEAPTSEFTFAIVPVGTGNDWGRTHKIPNDYKKALVLIKSGNTMKHDIGKADYLSMEGEPGTRYFINVAGLAYDAYVTKMSQEKKRWAGNKLFYFYLIATGVLTYKAVRAKIIFDGQEHEDTFYSIALGVCKYNGGGAQFVPHAIPDDGLFALTMFSDVKPWQVIYHSPKFYNGKIGNIKQAKMHQVKHMKVEPLGEIDTLVEVDGEFLGKAPVEFTMMHHALNVVVP